MMELALIPIVAGTLETVPGKVTEVTGDQRKNQEQQNQATNQNQQEY